jgi:hypothetical protein
MLYNRLFYCPAVGPTFPFHPRFRISPVLFQYREEHQCPIRGKILKPITCVELSPGLSGHVTQMISEASKNSGANLT